MPVGSLTSLELKLLRQDYNREIGSGTQCTILRIQDGIIAKDGSLPADTPTPIYTGPCYLTPIEARRDRWDDRGADHVYQNQYRVVIPWDSGVPMQGDWFRVTSSHADSELIGRTMMIKDVHFESELGVRRLTVLDLHD